jgi:hypothetical protein
MKLFKRLLNCTVSNSMILFRQVTGQNIDQVQLVEGLFNKYAQERIVAGRWASGKHPTKTEGQTFHKKSYSEIWEM